MKDFDKKEPKNEEEKKDNNQDDNQDNLMTEEELKRVLEKFKKTHNNYQIVKSAVFYHPNLGMHILIAFIMNIIASITAIGILNIINPAMVSYNIGSYFLAIAIFTLLSNVISIIVAYFLLKRIWFIYGFVNFLIQILALYLVTLMTNKTFSFSGFPELLLFALLFTIVNYLLSLLYRKLLLRALKRIRK